MTDPQSNQVNLVEFASWAISRDWDIPAELQEFAKSTQTRPIVSEVTEAVCGRVLIDFKRTLVAEVSRRRNRGDEHGADVLMATLASLTKMISEKVENPSELDTTSKDYKEFGTSDGHNYVSQKLANLNHAATRFWQNADPQDRGTHPTNATVAQWLEKQGFSQTLAEKAATLIRPEWAPTGRKPDE